MSVNASVSDVAAETDGAEHAPPVRDDRLALSARARVKDLDAARDVVEARDRLALLVGARIPAARHDDADSCAPIPVDPRLR